MKRFLSAFIAVAMMVTMLASCGAPASSATPVPTGSAAPAPAPAEKAKTWEEAGCKTPLADVRIRQALAYAIDMDAIVNSLFEGKAEVATSMTAPGDWLATGLESYSYNVEKAKALLTEAGWPAGYTLDVVYYYGDQQTVDLMTIIGQYWSDVGVKAQFRKLEGDLTQQLWIPPADKVNGPAEVKWDMAYAAVAALAEHEFYDRFMSTAANNSNLPKQDGLDELILATSATADTQKQIKAFNEVQKAMNANVYQMPLYHQVAFIYTSDQIDTKGNKFGNEQFAYQKNIPDWETKRADKTLYTNEGPIEFFFFPNVNPGGTAAELIFDTLIAADSQLNPTEGLMAESYKLSDDQLNLEFVLRDDQTWHDGKPVTPEDVKFSVELYLKAAGTNSIAANTFKSIKGAKEFAEGKAGDISGIVIDGKKITMQFEKIAPNALTVFAQWPILPKHLLSKVDPLKAQQDAFWQKPVGSGEFMVDQVKNGDHCTLKRNPNYWKKGTGNIEKVWMFASSGDGDPNLTKNAEAGKIDFAWGKSTDDAKAIEKIAGMTTNVAKIRYTRLFYINQFPHEPNIK
ncbi:MAG: ABC transporter substrate-binding protein [Angelakisella sp.]